MTGFPLFRLSFVPLKSVLDLMDLGKLIRLHLCSKKTRQSLKATGKAVDFNTLSLDQKQNMNILEKLDLLRLEAYNDPRGSCFPETSVNTIAITADNGIEMKIVCDKRNRYKSLFPLLFYVESIAHEELFAEVNGSLQVDGITAPVVMKDKHTIHTFWEDQSDGLNVLVEYLKKIFNAQTINYFIDGSKDPMFSQNLRTVVKGMAQQTIYKCEVYNGIMDDDDYKYILDNVNPSFRFKHENVDKNRSDDFRHNTSFSSIYFKLEPANWFTFENLITMDCENIKLMQSRLTNDDLCNYVLLWISGKLAKLDSLSVELQENVNLDYIFSDLKTFENQQSSKVFAFIRESDTILINESFETVAKIIKTNTNNVIEFQRTLTHFDR